MAVAKEIQVGYLVIFRKHSEEFLGCATKGLRVCSNIRAECASVILAMLLAVQHGWFKLWTEGDSMPGVKVFTDGKVPWMFKADYGRLRNKLTSLRFSHTFREANFSADLLSKRGATL